MNYHLMIDEKFTGDFIADAERYAPGNNTYLVSLYTKEPKFAKSPLITHVRSVKRYWFSHVAPTLKNNDKVFIHWLDRRVYDIVLSLPPGIKVGIFSWMGDLIATPGYLFDKDILKPKSFDFFKKHKKYRFEKYAHHGSFQNLLLFGRHVCRLALSPVEWRKKKEVMRRIDLFFHWNEFDYQWVAEHYPGFHAKFVYFFYDIGLADDVEPLAADTSNNNPVTVWLGNSATITNNHFEALDDLAHLKEGSIEIICPLSYGERTDSRYTRQVMDHGKRIFGERFIPLLEYLDRDKYYALFSQADIVVMNHIRSQAAGNVFMFLKLGKIIFMDERSTLYRFLRSKKTENLYTMNDLRGLSPETLKRMLSEKAASCAITEILDINSKSKNLENYLN